MHFCREVASEAQTFLNFEFTFADFYDFNLIRKLSINSQKKKMIKHNVLVLNNETV